MKIAVTGSAGFIGKNLTKNLIAAGNTVTEIDITTGIDICDYDQLEKAGNFDLVFHLAAKTFVPDSFSNPLDFYKLNVLGTLNILELCRHNNAKIVFISSYVYGKPDYLPIDENHPLKPFNPYCQTKIIAEQLCQAYNRDFNVHATIIRPFNIYGTGQNPNFLIPDIIKQAKRGSINLKDQRPKRDFLHIDDLVDILIKASKYNDTTFEIFNAGSGQSHSVEQVTGLVNKLCDNKLTINYANQQRPNEVLDTVADITKAKKLLNWTPKTPLQDGLKKMLTEN